ncbi:sensor histidine kinase [Streptomyces triticagri]|uniref:histidine kinase n=1 Tax=Streptomyces triticagri TaxID=2293568 RepID=A0A372LVT0_9ACTN|nr:histidine kinase [Streptomyces triticagri]RFU82782.1 sensor histidine kinase [Streptomyces triticagri]
MTGGQPRTAWYGRRSDVLLAVGLLCFAWLGLALQQEALEAGTVALVLLIVAPLLVRHRWPLGALAVCLAASGAYHLLNYPHEAVLLPLVVVLYTVAAAGSRTRSLVVAAGTVAVTALGMAVSGVDSPVEAFGVIGWIAFAVALGEVTRARSVVHAATADRAVRAEREREAESALRRAETAQRAAEARRQIAEERLRIARDLHDVLAHNMAVINAQSSVVSHLDESSAEPPPGALSSAMRTIAETSRTAMSELRATLDVLRGHGAAADPADEPSVLPSLARPDGLVESARAAGVDVTLHTTGAPRDLAHAVDVTAYRIVQESLTNVARHAAGAPARVTLAYLPDALRLTVRNGEGERAGEGGTGSSADVPERADSYGILGMTERAEAIGGHLTAGPLPEGGFEVVADLPAPEGDRPGRAKSR